jgi:site-specific DNA-methyltransferase (adenine-specific)
MEINKIYCESNLETMAKMPEGFIDLTVTSPPYDNLRTYNGYSFDFESVAKELFRVTKEGGVVVWVVGDATIKGSKTGTSFKQALFFKECGFNFHDTIIWQKPNYAPMYPSVKRYDNNYEFVFIFSKGQPKSWNPIKDRIKKESSKKRSKYKTSYINKDGGRTEKESTSNNSEFSKRNNVWIIPNGQIRGLNHPAVFPEQLANDHIISWSNENDLVYDCFMGSGTSAKMSIINKRNFIGSEISQEYVNIANKRIEPHLNQQNLF